MAKSAKDSLKWQDFKRKWYDEFGTKHRCHYCGKWLNRYTLTLDHKVPYIDSPRLRFNRWNVVPSCQPCNVKKGRIHHEYYKHECHFLIKKVAK